MVTGSSLPHPSVSLKDALDEAETIVLSPPLCPRPHSCWPLCVRAWEGPEEPVCWAPDRGVVWRGHL